MLLTANGVELYVETTGDSTDAPLLLIGLTVPSWPSRWCATLTDRYVVRYDLRDTGRSTSVEAEKPGYRLRDLVTDVSALLTRLGLRRAHVVGLGVGGFIAQLLALDHPHRVATLTLISTRPVAPGRVDPDLPDHDEQVMRRMFGRPEPDWTDRDGVIEYMTGSAKLLSGPRGFDAADARATAGAVFDHAPPTTTAQKSSHLGIRFAAMDCRPRWRDRLGEITAPTLVVHGDRDPFFPHGNGAALAAEIPGARLLTLPGIGQGIPRETWPTVSAALLRHTAPSSTG